ncbi:MAG TPA: hypothetical protein VGC07_04975 [Granulicella sp.]
MQAFMEHAADEAASFGDALKEDARWQLVLRVSASRVFSRSPRLAHLLQFLCEQAILDRTHLLTEQNIASKVFDRKANFDPVADTIVRSQMLRLRQRLEAYFREEGIAEPLSISIPKGGYTPLFQETPVAPVVTEVEPTVSVEPEPVLEEPKPGPTATSDRWPAITRWLAIVCLILSVFSVFAGILLFGKRSSRPSEEVLRSPSRHRLWRSLFGEHERTLIVAADSGLVMLHGATRQNTSLSEYLSRDFSRELEAVPEERRGEVLAYAKRRYTSFVDLELIDRLTHLPEAVRGDYSIRFARDISVNDLKNVNVILSGSQDANPWLELFEPQMNFVLQDDLSHGVRAFFNRTPRQGEENLYRVSQDEYGVLAFLPNLSGTGSVLIIEGTSVAGTQAISDFLFMDSELGPFLEKITRKDGTIPKFEILLGSRSLAGSAGHPRILAYRTD